MVIKQLSNLIIARENPSSLGHAARNAVAAIVSYLVARLFGLPEAYWAPISTLIVIQSTVGAALPISVQSFAGTAIGAALGAATATYFRGSLWAFGITVFLIGLLCAVVHVERSVYRYASITLAIVMLAPRSTSAWLIATHRFFEVSLGIVVGLVFCALWPERQSWNGADTLRKLRNFVMNTGSEPT
jgi:uncharacterized membrane protein YgaE (UPF0421/DUF939 family)